jgi:DNA invertase Pin-like site-specific DNA recombinase
MKRQWTIRRTALTRSDAVDRWDRAYQHLLRWATQTREEPRREEEATDARSAIYARVSTARQARAQKADQQVERLKAYAKQKGWTLGSDQLYLDEGYSGASLNRVGLDALRDAAAMAEFDVVLITAPDRLARKYVHQVLLIEELQQRGCRVEFVERPMSSDPNDQLLLQIRGAVAEYERTLIAERLLAWIIHRRPGRAASRSQSGSAEWLEAELDLCQKLAQPAA